MKSQWTTRIAGFVVVLAYLVFGLTISFVLLHPHEEARTNNNKLSKWKAFLDDRLPFRNNNKKKKKKIVKKNALSKETADGSKWYLSHENKNGNTTTTTTLSGFMFSSLGQGQVSPQPATKEPKGVVMWIKENLSSFRRWVSGG